MNNFATVAVLGAGTMGAGIAAHLASCGVNVYLFDLPSSKSGVERSQLAIEAKTKILSQGLLMADKFIDNISAKNFEDDLASIKNCDWVIECIAENLALKSDLYQKLSPYLKEEAVISSNTSTLPLANLIKGQSSKFVKNFMITHFFNPPRKMQLLELVSTEHNNPLLVEELKEFIEDKLGKTIVDCADKPGFIANRIGCFWLETGFRVAIKYAIPMVDADYLISKVFGVPKTGIFGLWDLIGIDVMKAISQAILKLLPEQDEYHQAVSDYLLLNKMIKEKKLGNKSKMGFYKTEKIGEQKVTYMLDLFSNDYIPAEVSLEAKEMAKLSPQELFEHNSRYGEFAWEVMGATLNYAARLVGEIAKDVLSIDIAIKLGYNWQYGPFELIDRLNNENVSGAKYFYQKLIARLENPAALFSYVDNKKIYKIGFDQRLMIDNKGNYRPIPYNPNQLMLEDVKRDKSPMKTRAVADLWNIGDGVLLCELKTKLGSLNSELFDFIAEAIEITHKNYSGLVFIGAGRHFSAGADINFFYEEACNKKWKTIEDLLIKGQQLMLAVQNARFPTVAAVCGSVLGGGCELAMHSSAIQAYAETNMGLVESDLNLIPGWGGCKEAIKRSLYSISTQDFKHSLAKNLVWVADAHKTRSAIEAKESFLMNYNSGITMNYSKLLADSKKLVLKLANNYSPPQNTIYYETKPLREYLTQYLAKRSEQGEFRAEIYQKLIDIVLCKSSDGNVSEANLLKAEREIFLLQIEQEVTIRKLASLLKK